MARAKIIYGCESCGAQAPKWQGQCPECGAWNTLVEQAASQPARGMRAADARIETLAEAKDEGEIRTSTGIGELDRVLGGGLVFG